jgi:hypothetical protein
MPDHSDDPRQRKPIGYKSPPVEHQIKKGERRNPHGRRGKGKPKSEAEKDLSLAAIVREELTRWVPQKDGTLIEIHRRFVQVAGLKAANGNLPATRLVWSELRRLEDREEREQRELVLSALEYRHGGLEIFADHQRRRLEPPDIIPHPAHVVIEGNVVTFRGPVDHEGQLAWERLKRLIVVCTDNLTSAREHAREYPDEEWAVEGLASSQRFRRQVMRMVPKGWNWREQIWNRASVAEDRARDRLIQKMMSERQEREQNQA